MQSVTLPVAPSLASISKGKGIEVIEIATVTGSSSFRSGEYSNLEHVPDIDLSLLEGEDLSGYWWKRYDPPKELIWTGQDRCRVGELDFGEWAESLESVLRDLQNEAAVEEPPTPTVIIEEEQRPDPADVAPEVLVDAIEVIPPLPPANYQHRIRPQLAVNSMLGLRSAVELESPTSPTSAFHRRRSVADSLSSTGSKKSKQRRPSDITLTSSLDLMYTPLFTPLPRNDRTVASMPVSPRAEQIKRFWKRRTGESECSSCLDDHKNRKLVNLACQHKYCQTCLDTLIKTAIQDESLWPPHCCIQDIPLRTIKGTLSKKDLHAYNDKVKEYAVPAADRIYCAQAACSAWIPPTVDGEIVCPKCNFNVCRTCRGAAHPAQEDCPEDFELQATLQEGERQGWRRCFQCRTMLERTDGCNHMTCKCSAEFCYICGEVWKTCECRPDEEQHRRRARDEQEAALRTVQEQEEAEVRAAIAASEAMARRELEEQARREQAIMLEAVKLKEQQAAREKVMQERWVRIVDAKFEEFQGEMCGLHRRQWEMLRERHWQEMECLETERTDYERESNEKLSEGMKVLAEGRAQEMDAQRVRFEQELEALSNQQATEEDEYWFGLQSYLKGRPNKEAREKVLMEKFSATQREQMDALRQQQETGSAELELLLKEKLTNLQDTMAIAHEAERRNGVIKKKDTTRHHYADINWFEAVKAARSKKLVELGETTKTSEDSKERFVSRWPSEPVEMQS